MPITFSNNNLDVDALFPFTLTRKVEDIRIGIFTIKEKWNTVFEKVIRKDVLKQYNYIIAANLLPDANLIKAVKKMQMGDKIFDLDGTILVECGGRAKGKKGKSIVVENSVSLIYPWHIFLYNAISLTFDFALAKKGKHRLSVPETVFVKNEKSIFIEEGAVISHAIINAEEGPVFISKDAVVMEGALLRGPLFVGEGAVVKMGAKIYGATTIGPYCTVGGEIKNSVFFGYSNKAHDGYLGDSVIGEWCNLGAGTTNSNLKNTAGNIAVHLLGKQYILGNKCGAFIGDYSRTAINTSINTGTVIGTCANVFGSGLTPKYIPSFSWGFDRKRRYKLDKALLDINNWKKLKNENLARTEADILTTIYKNKK